MGFKKTTYMAITHTYLSLNMPLPTLAKEHPKHKSPNTNDSGFSLMHTPIQLIVMRKSLRYAIHQAQRGTHIFGG